MNYIKVLFLSFICQSIIGQQLPLFTQYSEYQGVINAAAINYDYFQDGYDLSFGASFRDQWIEAPDRPRTYAIRGEKVHVQRRGMSFIYGGYLIRDQAGAVSNTGLTGRVAGIFRLFGNSLDESALSVGMNFGMFRYAVNLDEFRKTSIDPLVFQERATRIYPDVGLGVNFYSILSNDDYIAIGLSIPQVLGLDLSYKNGDNSFTVRRVRHYYLTSSYYMVLGDDRYFEFSGWVKKVQNVPFNVDLNVRYKFVQNMWLGVGYNTSSIIHTEIGYIFNNWDEDRRVKIGYAYNPSWTTYGVSFGATHELNLSYLMLN